MKLTTRVDGNPLGAYCTTNLARNGGKSHKALFGHLLVRSVKIQGDKRHYGLDEFRCLIRCKINFENRYPGIAELG